MRFLDTQLVSFSFAPLPLFNLLMMFKLIFCFMALAVLVQASPLSRRAAHACTCGSTSLDSLDFLTWPFTSFISERL